MQVLLPYLLLKLEERYKRAEEEEPEGRSGLFQMLYPGGHFLWEVHTIAPVFVLRVAGPRLFSSRPTPLSSAGVSVVL